MNAALLPITGSDSIALLSPKALGAWNALETRYASQISPDELDYLFALFVLGLTNPFYAKASPLAHLDACRTLMSQKLDGERVERALRSVPAATQGWVEKAFLSIEQLGAKDGRALFEQQQKSNQTINAIELTPAGKSGGSGETS
ncbi:hypothetical protein [Agrobacterium tumefaciens]|uniref:hypothetical protein n=1 Tax=Agrobacterium tumefaciens TaxID=358 RepID=UPI0022443649|nr:hypothetical protein [Agrobacterium tumefaciens]MCW8060427.1 hypothetical protein [Agrobacterium tumefaciens]MCW8145871.1 hypothetical protein [Agrobacterium tumefaciens]